jgi:hypothetical protein
VQSVIIQSATGEKVIYFMMSKLHRKLFLFKLVNLTAICEPTVRKFGSLDVSQCYGPIRLFRDNSFYFSFIEAFGSNVFFPVEGYSG